MRRNLFGGPKHDRQVEVADTVRFLIYGGGHYFRMAGTQDFHWMECAAPMAALKGNMLVPVRHRGQVTVSESR